MGLGFDNSNCYYCNSLEVRLMSKTETNYHKIELEIRNMLKRYKLSNFTSGETRRCIAEVITAKLKDKKILDK